MTSERELKLELQHSDVLRLKRSALFGPMRTRKTKTLKTVYFDTPKQRLLKSGFTLRIRECEGCYIQTLKAQGIQSFGIYAREEWEWPVAGPLPDFNLLETTPVAERAAKPRFRSKLAARFETRVVRLSRIVSGGGAEIEIALDDGTVVSGERSIPLHSLEFELKVGSKDALFSNLSALPKGIVPRIDVQSKSERGYALWTGANGTAFKAEPIAFEDDPSTADAFRAAMASCLRQFRLNEPGVLHRDAEALHQARVAIRRCRSALSFFKPVLADETFEGHRTNLRQLSRALGAARDLDVFLSHPALETAPPEAVARARQGRERCYDALAHRLKSTAYRETILALAQWIECGAWSQVTPTREKTDPHRAAVDFAQTRLKAWRRKIEKGGRDLRALAPHDRHRVRIGAKKLRYASEFVATLYDASSHRHRKFVTALEAMQTDLGALNDQAFGHELLDRLTEQTTGNGQPDINDPALLAAAERSYRAWTKTKAFWT